MDLSNLKKLRREKGLLQKDIAKYLGITIASYSLYENSKRTPPIEILQKLCNFYNVDLELLLGWRNSIQTRTIIDPSIDSSLQQDNNYQSFNFAIQKFQNNEELTYEEGKIITEYVNSDQFKQEKEDIKQIAKKAYNYIAYNNSYSYASSDDDFNKIQDAKQIELEKKRARMIIPSNIEMEEPPRAAQITQPLNSRDLPEQNQSKKFDFLDENYFNYIRFKIARKEPLTEEEEAYRIFHLSKIFRIDAFAIYYFLLNKEGKSKADEIIDRAIEQITLLTKIPEYQSNPPEPPQE